MNKDAEAKAVEIFRAYRGDIGVMRLMDVINARIERHRDRLEGEDSEQTRGRIKELREIMRVLSE